MMKTLNSTKKASTALLLIGFLHIAPSAAAHSTDIHAYYPKPKVYPFETCLVSDEKLGKRGKVYVITHKRQEIKLCCKQCQMDFKKDPAKYLLKLSKPK